MIFLRRENVWGKEYKGLTIKSDYRAHEEAFNIINHEIGNKDNLKVLDIATGTGAFSKRLQDFFPSWKIEINDFESQAEISQNSKFSVDLNSDFGGSFSSEKYDVVIALEIIEHLENPWNFLREIKKLMKKDGVLILSTPNIDSTLDRFSYLIEGFPVYFGERGYENSEGHISPVPDWLFKKMANVSGYSSVYLFEGIKSWPLMGIGTFLKILIFAPFGFLFMKRKNNRAVNLYLCRN